MGNRRYSTSTVTFSGSAGVRLDGAKVGDTFVVVQEVTLRAVEDRQTAHHGDETVAKLRVGEVIVLSDAEAADFRERLAEQRRVREDNVNPDQGQLGASGPEAVPNEEG